MRLRLQLPTPRFHRSIFRGRCRRNLLVGLAALALGVGYAGYAGARFARRGADLTAFDQPLVHAAATMVRAPVHLRSVEPSNDREVYLVTVISDQQDVMFGMTVLLLRLLITLTMSGLGLVLLTAGATEWQVRSETASPAPSVV